MDDNSDGGSDCSNISSFTLGSFSPQKRKVIIVNMPERLPAIIRDELRRVVALKCFDTLFRRDSCKITEQRDLMYDMFHGNQRRNIISVCDQLCHGEGIYGGLFEDRTDVILSRQGTGTDEPTLQLKMLYSRREKSYLLGENAHINMKILAEKDYKSSTLLTGRTIHSQAKKTLTTVRKAYPLL